MAYYRDARTRKERKNERKKSREERKNERNKPDRAKMRPDCVSACIDHVTYTERQMDEQTGETTE